MNEQFGLQHMNQVATSAALVKQQIYLLDDTLRNIAAFAEQLRVAAQAAANELVRP